MAIDQEKSLYIRYLHDNQKYSIRAIQRKTGISRKTIKKVLDDNQPEPARLKPSKLDPFKPEIIQIIDDKPAIPTCLILEILCNKGYDGGKSIVYDFVHHYRYRPPQAFIPLEHLPAQQAQVDWGECGCISCGQHQRKLYFFGMTLCYSRYLFVEFTVSMDMDTFLAGHVHAFEFFGGVPYQLLYDNLKCVVTQRIGKQIHFNPRFLDFAAHYDFTPKACNVRSPHEKGKVERAMGYVKKNFLARGPFENFDHIQLESKNWQNQIANRRLHAVTRKIPQEAFVKEEKALLKPLPAHQYDYSSPQRVPVDKVCLVHFQANRYSVPSKYAYSTVTLKATTTQIKIYDQTQLIAVHRRCYDKHQLIKNLDHYKELLAQKQQAQSTAEIEKFKKLCTESQEYLSGLVKHQKNAHYHVRKILELVQTFGQTTTAAAMVKALQHQAFHWEYIKNIILESGLVHYQTHPVLTKHSKQILEIEVDKPDLSQYDKF